ncbi:hypothetical protein TSIB_1953 [Thermococcus sibiricus MM 739]|uniref:Uncharacterized protein n=1 Tax=Thermococcus sibiricus (strain DSM 12597 / MM 739) TaxID=604354 RepID=C6A021_THESM|nr:hypothetical protein TSIB_1953 [Thermococcus sibiricus MM 739]
MKLYIFLLKASLFTARRRSAFIGEGILSELVNIRELSDYNHKIV